MRQDDYAKPPESVKSFIKNIVPTIAPPAGVEKAVNTNTDYMVARIRQELTAHVKPVGSNAKLATTVSTYVDVEPKAFASATETLQTAI